MNTLASRREKLKMNALFYNDKLKTLDAFQHKYNTRRKVKQSGGGTEAATAAAAQSDDGAGGDTMQKVDNENEQVEERDITMSDITITDYSALSDLSVTQFETKMTQIQSALNDIDFTMDIISVPNIFFSEQISSDRFRYSTDCNSDDYDANAPKFNFIIMVNRKNIVKKIHDQLKKKRTTMVYGPQGCGKSFIIIQFVASLLKDGHFVVYINNAINLLRDLVNILVAKLKSIHANVDDTVKAIYRTKHNDEPSIDTIKADPNLTMEFIRLAAQKIQDWQKQQAKGPNQSESKKLYFVIDQLDKARKHNEFLKELGASFTCVFGSSANNDAIDYEIKGEDSLVDEELVRFDDDQFRALCVILKSEFTYSERAQIMSVTGAVALQLAEFVQDYYEKMKITGNTGSLDSNIGSQIGKKPSLDDMIAEYKDKMHLNVLSFKSLQRYLSELDSVHKGLHGTQEQAIDNIRNMIRDSKHKKDNSTFDRRFLYRSADPENKGRLQAISALAFTSCLNYYSSPIVDPKMFEDDPNGEWFSTLMNDDTLPPGTRGSLIERYIIHELIRRKNSKDGVRLPVEISRGARRQVRELHMLNYDVLYFNGKLAPSHEHLNKNTLIVPHDSQYPGFDVFYYDINLKRLYAIQITNREDPMSHVADNDADKGGTIIKALKFWKHAFLPSDAEIIEIWYIGKQKFLASQDSERKNSLNVIYFEESTQNTGLPLLGLV